MPTDEVERWISAARAGSAEALGQLLQNFRPFLLLLANQHLEPALRGKVGPSDVVQDTFVEAQRDFPRFQGNTEEEIMAWLRQMLLHNLANVSRHYQQTEKRQIEREVALPADPAAAPPGGLVDDSASPEAKAIAGEESRQLHAALERLPEHYREVILLRHRDHLSFEAIGARLQRSPEASRKLWVRGIDLLREMLEPSHEPG